MDCVFCKIELGEIPSYTIYEDDMIRVFLDIHPDSMGHTLIVPKRHYQDLDDMDEQVLFHIMSTAKKIKNRLETVLGCNGVTLIQNNGSVQEIKHFHLHLKPHYLHLSKKLSVEEVYQLLKK